MPSNRLSLEEFDLIAFLQINTMRRLKAYATHFTLKYLFSICGSTLKVSDFYLGKFGLITNNIRQSRQAQLTLCNFTTTYDFSLCSLKDTAHYKPAHCSLDDLWLKK